MNRVKSASDSFAISLVKGTIKTADNSKTVAVANKALKEGAVELNSERFFKKPAVICGLVALAATNAVAVAALVAKFGPLVAAQKMALFLVPGMQALSFIVQPFLLYAALPVLSTLVVSAISLAITLYIMSKAYAFAKDQIGSLIKNIPGGEVFIDVMKGMKEIMEMDVPKISEIMDQPEAPTSFVPEPPKSTSVLTGQVISAEISEEEVDSWFEAVLGTKIVEEHDRKEFVAEVSDGYASGDEIYKVAKRGQLFSV